MSGYALRHVPVGIPATGMRREAHGTGSIEGTRASSTAVRADRYWGASTQLSLRAGLVATDRLPERFHRCYGIAKKSAAVANGQAGRLPAWKVEAVALAADDLIGGRLSDHFPLTAWQSGSGRETDTNVNEVLANRAIQLLGAAIGSRAPVDPARDVNMAQNLTGMFTTTLHIAIVMELEETLVPAVAALARALDRASMPSLSLRLRAALSRIDESEGGLHEIVSGGTHHDQGMSEPDWLVMAASITRETGRPFVLPPEGLQVPSSLDAVVAAMSAVRGLALSMLDVAEPRDVTSDRGSRDWTSQGRSTLEALSMVCTQVIGFDQVVASASSRGNRDPRALRPLIVMSVLNAIRTLGEASASVRRIIAPVGRK